MNPEMCFLDLLGEEEEVEEPSVLYEKALVPSMQHTIKVAKI